MKKIILLVGLLISQATVAATEQYNFTKLAEPATVDGAIDEAVWQQASSYQLAFNTFPGDSTPAKVETEVRLFYTENSLFIAFIAQDPNPEEIRAYLRDRDTLWQDDFVGIVIDSFNDERRGYEFFANPKGAQGDGIVDDTQGGNEDMNWDAIWNSAGQMTDFGYVIEMEIPFSTLRFPADKESLTWGIDLLRIYPRDSRYQFRINARDKGSSCYLCQLPKFTGLKNVKQGSNFQFTPTLTAIRSDFKDVTSEDGAPTELGDWQNGDIDPEFGFDLRWGVNEGLVINATVNPDFSQVEADSAQLDINNTFSLFFPEKRPFFLDGKDYFDTTRMNLVHTRNIASPDYGTKITGKKNGHTYGALVSNDESTTFLIPGALGSDIYQLSEADQDGNEQSVESDILIARYRKDIGERNNLGAIITKRSSGDYQNTVASVDGIYQINKDNKLSYQIAYSDTSNPDYLVADYAAEDGEEADFRVLPEQSDVAYSLHYQYSQKDYSLRANYDNFGEDFRSDLGFVSKVDFERWILGGYHVWRNDDESSKWTETGISGDWDKTWDQSGQVLEEEAEIYSWIQGPKQFFAEVGYLVRDRFWDGTLFDEDRISLYARIDPIPNLRVSTWLATGDEIDFANSQLGESTIIEFAADWKWGESFSTDFDLTQRKLEVPGGELFSATQYDVRFNYQFNIKSYLRWIVQFTDIDRNPELYQDDDVESRSKYINTQLIYAYKINPQTLFYLGYSDAGFQDDYLDNIERDSRSVFMKMSYAWQL